MRHPVLMLILFVCLLGLVLLDVIEGVLHLLWYGLPVVGVIWGIMLMVSAGSQFSTAVTNSNLIGFALGAVIALVCLFVSLGDVHVFIAKWRNHGRRT